MRYFRKIFCVVFCCFLSTALINAAENILFSLKGNYLAYSFDFNQIYGENITFQLSTYSVTSKYIKIDVQSRTFCAYGEVTLKSEKEKFQSDEFFFNPKENKGILINYTERIKLIPIGTQTPEKALTRSQVIDTLTLAKIQKSLIYFTTQHIEITDKLKVYGYNVTLHVEGLESVGFKKFNMSEGFSRRRQGISLDKIWYTRSQGIVGRVSYLYEKKGRINSLTQLNYEEHSVLKNYQGLERQVDIMSSTTVNIDKNSSLGLIGNYNSSNLWNARVLLNKNWSKKITTLFDFTYNKPLNLRGEAWLGLQSSLNAGKLGNISFAGRYEFLQDQILTQFNYTNAFFKKLNFMLFSSYSQVKIGQSKQLSKIFSGGANISYKTRIFNLSTDYYLNYDLFGHQLLSQPQLRVGINPFRLYGGLLSVSIYNVFILNRMRLGDQTENTYSNNTIFNLSAQPLYIQKSFSVNFNISLEQFLEKEGRNFTSGGLIIRARKEFLKGVYLECMYSAQTRRKTQGWLIEGTTSQDLSALLRVNPLQSLDAWVSISYDPKNNQWRQSFTDISIGIVRNWRFHSLINYDFLLKKVNNIDLYLIREAGRFQLRFIWRSLSKQFLLELIPR